MAKEIFQMRERLAERDEEVTELKAERSNIKVFSDFSFSLKSFLFRLRV